MYNLECPVGLPELEARYSGSHQRPSLVGSSNGANATGRLKSHRGLLGKDSDNTEDLWVAWRKVAGRAGRVVWDSSVGKTQTAQ